MLINPEIFVFDSCAIHNYTVKSRFRFDCLCRCAAAASLLFLHFFWLTFIYSGADFVSALAVFPFHT